MLYLKSLSELEIYPFTWEKDQRIDLNVLYPISNRKLFKYKHIQFMLSITEFPELALYPALYKESSDRWWDTHPACVKKSIYCFLDQKDNQRKKITYWLIQLWHEIDSAVRDVIFYHELKEAHYMSRYYPQKIAHKKAEKEEQVYIQKFLPKQEKILLENIYQQWTEFNERSKEAIRQAIREGKIEIIKITKEGSEKIIL